MNENTNKPTGAVQSVPLDVSVKITPSKEDGNLLAFANITLGGCFAVRGVRVMDSEKGVFVAMPDKKNAKGEYHDICFPTTAEMRQAVNTAVLTEYQKVMEQISTRGAQTKSSVRDALQNAAKATADRPAPERPQAPPQRKTDKGAR